MDKNSKVIAIDASPVSLASGRGYRRHVLSLLGALAAAPDPYAYRVISKDPALPGLFSAKDGKFKTEPPRRRIPLLHRPGTAWLGKIFLGGIDLVHFPCSDIWYGRRGKSVVTLHDLAPLHFPDRFFKDGREEAGYRRHLNQIVECADQIVTVSEFSRKDILRQLKIEPERIQTVHNAVDPIFLGKRDPEGRPPFQKAGEAPYFLFVGGLDFRKNIPLLLEAFFGYRDRGGKANLVLAGKHDERNPRYYPPIQPLLAGHPAGRHVVCLRNISDPLLPALYRGALGLVFCSSFEGFGYPLIEAMASDLPILCSGTASLPEIAGDAALFVGLNSEEIARALTRIEKEPSLREPLKSRGRERLKHFLPERLARDMAGVYGRVMEGNFS